MVCLRGSILVPAMLPSRPGLAAQYENVEPSYIGLSPATPLDREQWLLIFHTCDPLSVPSLQMVDGSLVTVLAFVLSYSLSSSTSEPGGLLSSPQRVRTASLVAGSFARPPSPCAPFPISPLPCLRSETVWLVLWLVTALQGPCQWFVLRESAGLALFRSLTVPLLGSVPSRCRCFTLLTPLACFLWLFVFYCGTGWASPSIDNL